MARRLLLTAALGLIVSGTGCVSKEKYVAKDIELQQAKANAAAMETALAGKDAEANAYKAQQERWAQQAEAERAKADASAQIAVELEKKHELLMRQYEKALNQPQVVVGMPLPAELNAALKDLAAANSTVMEYDSSRGMIKFKSDFTFPTSSDQLKPEAKAAVKQLAAILNSPAARSFEFFVAGHTDNVPVSRPETIKAGHKDNSYLSSHRAITVAKELKANGIEPARIGHVGYGEHRPAADNTTTAGRAKNRRVEVLILPTSVRSPSSTAGNIGNTPAKRTEPTLNKDTAVDVRDTGPVLDK